MSNDAEVVTIGSDAPRASVSYSRLTGRKWRRRLANWCLDRILGFSQRRSRASDLDTFLLLNAVVRQYGLSLNAAHPFWSADPEFEVARKMLHDVGIRMRERKYVLFRLARAAGGLGGDTAECGCFRGESSFLICLGRGFHDSSYHHIFDSFEGLSAPASVDRGARKWKKHDLAESLERVQERLAQFSWVRYHFGWIPSQFGKVADRSFSFVHIDVDLYEPTLRALEFFYPPLRPGGYLVCDDYAFLGCPGATKAFDEFVSDKAEKPVVYLGTGQGFIVKR